MFWLLVEEFSLEVQLQKVLVLAFASGLTFISPRQQIFKFAISTHNSQIKLGVMTNPDISCSNLLEAQCNGGSVNQGILAKNVINVCGQR
jgi:hypothetical protein